jgi:hypothetical protein
MFTVVTMGRKLNKSSSKDMEERYANLKKGIRASLCFLALLGSFFLPFFPIHTSISLYFCKFFFFFDFLGSYFFRPFSIHSFIYCFVFISFFLLLF